MVLGFLLIAMLAGALASALLFFASSPLWLVLLACPVVGSAALLMSVFARIGFAGHHQQDAPEPALTAPCPAPQR